MKHNKTLNAKQIAELKRIRQSIVGIYCSAEMYEPETKASNIPLMMKLIMQQLDSIISFCEKG